VRPPKNFGLQQPTPSLPNDGGSSNGLEDRETLARNRQGSRPPVRAAKNWRANEKAADPCGWLRLSSQSFERASKPDHAFGVTRQYIGKATHFSIASI